MSFHFRYESLLQARVLTRDQHTSAVATTTGRIDELQQAAIQWQRQIDDLHRDATRKRTGVVTIVSLTATEQQDEYLSQRLAQCQSEHAVCKQQLAVQRQALIQAQLELKRLEVLRDNEQAIHQAAQQRKNQQETDDINNASRYFRPAV